MKPPFAEGNERLKPPTSNRYYSGNINTPRPVDRCRTIVHAAEPASSEATSNQHGRARPPQEQGHLTSQNLRNEVELGSGFGTATIWHLRALIRRQGRVRRRAM
jgi:hypothetical protein